MRFPWGFHEVFMRFSWGFHEVFIRFSWVFKSFHDCLSIFKEWGFFENLKRLIGIYENLWEYMKFCGDPWKFIDMIDDLIKNYWNLKKSDWVHKIQAILLFPKFYEYIWKFTKFFLEFYEDFRGFMILNMSRYIVRFCRNRSMYIENKRRKCEWVEIWVVI